MLKPMTLKFLFEAGCPRELGIIFRVKYQETVLDLIGSKESSKFLLDVLEVGIEQLAVNLTGSYLVFLFT